MVYSITGQGINKTAIISGNNGKYGNPEKDSSIFGRNAVNNFNEYNLKELGKPIQYNNPPAFNYEVQYSPDKNPNSDVFKSALMASSDEDLSGKPVSVKDMTASLQKILGSKATAEALDLNGDGKIDQAENAAYTLLQDACDNQDPNNPQINLGNIDGKFTKAGHENSSFVFAKNNVDNNRSLLQEISNKFKLGDEMNKLNPTTNNPDTSVNPNVRELSAGDQKDNLGNIRNIQSSPQPQNFLSRFFGFFKGIFG